MALFKINFGDIYSDNNFKTDPSQCNSVHFGLPTISNQPRLDSMKDANISCILDLLSPVHCTQMHAASLPKGPPSLLFRDMFSQPAL